MVISFQVIVRLLSGLQKSKFGVNVFKWTIQNRQRNSYKWQTHFNSSMKFKTACYYKKRRTKIGQGMTHANMIAHDQW